LAKGVILLLIGLPSISLAQLLVSQNDVVHKAQSDIISVKNQLDLIDIGLAIIKKKNSIRKDTVVQKSGRLYGSALPGVGYSLITGFAVTMAANGAFYTSKEESANISSIIFEPAYSQYHQLLLPIQANIWTRGNRYNIQTDWDYKKFPQLTYGLGSHTSLADGYTIDYSQLRLFQTLYKTIAPDLFLGAGYCYDYYYNIREVNPPKGVVTDFEKYGLTPTSTSSGITFDFLYDRRRNLINPKQSSFISLIYRSNLTFLGSDAHWQTLTTDLRKYVNWPVGSKNILAFWTYDVITLQGNPPYLALPNTASDTYGNTGRGYIQGRFRGKNMVYFETEYRFGITRNGLFGGVVFANVESFSEPVSGRFEAFWPAYGTGLRVKLNKYSNTNVCFDYAIGFDGSRGIFVNLGEIF
jgi:hypothetical protein